jgi:hypothetical protein
LSGQAAGKDEKSGNSVTDAEADELANDKTQPAQRFNLRGGEPCLVENSIQ